MRAVRSPALVGTLGQPAHASANTTSRATALASQPTVAWAFLVAGAAALGALWLLPALDYETLTPLVLLIAVGAQFVGIAVNRPARLLPFVLFAGASLMSIVIVQLWLATSWTERTSLTVASIAFYVLQAGAIIGMIHAHSSVARPRVALEVLVFFVGLVMIVDEFLLDPTFAALGVDEFGRLEALAFVTGDILVFAALVRLAIHSSDRIPARGLLAAASAIIILAEVMLLPQTLGLTTTFPRGVAVLATVPFVLQGAAMLHPSMRRIVRPAGTGERGRFRTFYLSAPVFLALAVAAMDIDERGHLTDPGTLVALLSLVALFALRFMYTTNELNRDRKRLVALSAALEASHGDLERQAGELTAALARSEALQEQLRDMAQHDPLTGLANRVLWDEALIRADARARRARSRTGVLVIDLDDFKDINDQAGHAIGDEVLVAVAGRLQTAFRTSDLPARLGGDEFGVLLEDVRGGTELHQLAARVLEVIQQPIQTAAGSRVVHASIGVAAGPADGDASDLVRLADHAMYRAKGTGGGIAFAQPADRGRNRIRVKAARRNA